MLQPPFAPTRSMPVVRIAAAQPARLKSCLLVSGSAPYRRWRARRIWLRDPARALKLLRPDVDAGERGDPESLSLASWLLLTYSRDEAAAERAARQALASAPDGRFASAALSAVLLNREAYDEAIAVLEDAAKRHPGIPWYEITIADALEEAGRADEAEARLVKAAASGPPLRRHALKRLSRLPLERGDWDEARKWFGELLGIAPDYLVYASDYVTAGSLELEAGNRDGAREIWARGASIYPRNDGLRALLEEHFGDAGPRGTPNIEAVSERKIGARRIPVRTPFITARTGLHTIVEESTEGVRRPGDVLVVAESAAAAGQGKLTPLELVSPGPLAARLSRFVGKIGPLHSPEGMQGAIMEAGRARVAAAAVAGAAGKVVKQRGWFYKVAGPNAAMIDDVAAALPPHDHHVIFGPRDPDGLARELADRLGCDVAIVDANHLTGAWVVGATPGVDRGWLTAALADNPAGNEDERTPIVIVRRMATETPSPEPAAS
jgi:tetratricopeptide (TPR) repeat protein